MPYLAVSPWQVIVRPPFYYGFIYYGLLLILALLLLIKDRTHKIDWLIGLLILFLFVNIISLMINWNILYPALTPDAADIKSPHFYNLLVIVYLIMNIVTVWLVKRIITTKELFERSMKIILWSSVIASIWGISMVLGHLSGILSENVLLVNLFPRLSGTATEPQVFGNFLLMILPVSWAFLTQRMNLFNYLAVFILGLSLVMTFSMGAWVGAGAGFVLFIVLSIKRIHTNYHLILISIMALILVMLILLSFIYPSYLKGFDKYVSKLKLWKTSEELKVYRESIKGQKEDIYRGDIVNRFDDKLQRSWMGQAAWNMFISKPVFGIGPGNYGFLYNEFKPAGTPRKPYMEKTHNAYLEILAETGIIGLAVFLAILIILITRSWPRTILGAGCYAAIVALLVHGLSFGILAHNYFWLAMGLLWAQKDLNA
jgi:MFS family permease